MIKKLLIASAALIAVGASVAYVQRTNIALALVEKVAAERMKNPLDGLSDGLHVGLCGTGSPFPDPQRAAPCTLVIAGKDMFLFDAGSAAAKQLTHQRQLGAFALRHELAGLVGARADVEGLQRQARVADPGVAVVPVALAADRLRQRGRRRRDDAAVVLQPALAVERRHEVDEHGQEHAAGSGALVGLYMEDQAHRPDPAPVLDQGQWPVENFL